MNKDIELMFNGLMAGDGSVINPDNIDCLNKEALRIYNIPQLIGEDINELKLIVMICNVLYNRTDMTVLPIEDGFYDLLLEKYKIYDDHFQVGSAIVELKNLAKNDIVGNKANQVRCPVSFFKQPERDELHQSVYNDIMRVGKPILNKDDFLPNFPLSNNTYINKRSHNTEHNHPMLVGTLDKCKFVTNQDAINAGAFNDPNVKVLERDFFQDHINKGIISPNQEIEIVCELKYDGISVEADCTNTVLSARTRGDTGIGAASDISPMLEGYRFKHAEAMVNEDPVGVKFEAIITKTNLYTFNKLRDRSYANCRSAIVGLFGASDAYLYRDLITLVPLALDREQFKYPITNRLEEIEFLNKVFTSNGEPLRYCYFRGSITEILYMIKAFWDEAKIARDILDFMYDGIVVSYLDENIRAALGRKNYINKYSIAVKFDPLEKQTIFRGYTYEIGQHGNVTPMIHYDPVEFLGTIHTKSTGSSYARFQELGLRYGDFINVTYVNDVMPYISRVECDHNRNNENPLVEFPTVCPVCGSNLVLSDSGKTAICPNTECPARSVQRMVNMFSKLNIKGFADSTFNALSEYDHLYKLYDFDNNGYITNNKLFYINRLGQADGEAFGQALYHITNDQIDDFMIMGSLGFTSMAYKKWKSILTYMKLNDMYSLYHSCGTKDEFRMTLYNMIPHIGDITCNTIANEWEFFDKDIEFIIKYCNIINSYGKVSEGKMQIRFSGCRNKQLVEQLSTQGYDIDDDSSVTKNTDILIVLYDGFESSKVKKARNNPNTVIVAQDEFIKNMDKYLVK